MVELDGNDEPNEFPVGDLWVHPQYGWVQLPNGQLACLHRDSRRPMVSESAIAGLPLGDVAEALSELADLVAPDGDWYEDEWFLSLQEDPHEETYPDVRTGVAFVPLGHDLVDVVVAVDGLRPRQDEAFEHRIEQIVAPLLVRWSADPGRVQRSGPWEHVLAVRFRLPTRQRSGGDIVPFAEELRALLQAARTGPLDRQTARDLIIARSAGALVGVREGGWLDAKGKPYRLHEDAQRFELAKDVSAFANADGGLILIPATTRVDRNGEVIDDVREMPLDLVDAGQMRDLLAEWVHPPIQGLEIEVIEVAPSRGHVMIHVPTQPKELWPHIVTRAPIGDRVRSTAVAICVRHNEEIRSLSAERVHSLLQAGRRAQEREREDVRLSAPDVVAELGGHHNEVGGRGRMLVTIDISNKGQTVARDLSCGLRYEGADARYHGREFTAEKDGKPLLMPALGLGDREAATVALDQGDMTPLRTCQERIADVLHPWVRYSDKRGNRHRWPQEEP